MSWRRFSVLVRHLPADSTYLTEVRDTTPEPDVVDLGEPPRFGPWRTENYQLASIQDALQALLWQNGGDSQAPRPKPTQRPVRPPSDNVRALNERARAYMEYLRTHQGAAPPEDWEPDLSEVTDG